MQQPETPGRVAPSTTEPPISIRGVHHVGVSMPADGIDAARAFYGGILGLRERPLVPNDSPHPLYWMQAGTTEIHFVVEAELTEANAHTSRHVCLLVDDVAAVRRHLEASGVPTQDQDFDMPSRPRFFARDPFGNRVEFLALVGDEAP